MLQLQPQHTPRGSTRSSPANEARKLKRSATRPLHIHACTYISLKNGDLRLRPITNDSSLAAGKQSHQARPMRDESPESCISHEKKRRDATSPPCMGNANNSCPIATQPMTIRDRRLVCPTRLLMPDALCVRLPESGFLRVLRCRPVASEPWASLTRCRLDMELKNATASDIRTDRAERKLSRLWKHGHSRPKDVGRTNG